MHIFLFTNYNTTDIVARTWLTTWYSATGISILPFVVVAIVILSCLTCTGYPKIDTRVKG